jgi:hypothetical protein
MLHKLYAEDVWQLNYKKNVEMKMLFELKSLLNTLYDNWHSYIEY